MPPNEPEHPRRRRRSILWKAILLSRASRRWRWTFRLGIAIPLLLIAALIVLTHSPLTRVLVLPSVARATGLNVDANWVHIRSDGALVMDNATFTIPGVAGEPGRFLRMPRLEAEINWWKTLRGSPTIGRVSMTDPVLVVSQSVADGSLNIGSIPVQSGPERLQLPGFIATNVGIELGEHGPAGYKSLKRIQMDGSLTPTPGAPGTYTVKLFETNRRTGAARGTGFTLGGTVNDGRIDLNLLNFSLSDWPPSTLPLSFREIAEGLDLIGDVTSARFTYTRDGGITAIMDLRDVAMNLPLEASVQGPVFQPEGEPPPARFMRMSGVAGRITFARDSVVARVGGLIEDLPYEVTLRYDGVDEDSPFNLDFVSKDFHMSRNPELLLYAPPVVKYYLKTFLMPTGVVTTRVNVRRAPSGPTEPGAITVSGSLDFHSGTAAYEGFPYEFNDMTGRFEFDNDEIRVVSVTGQSRTGARLQASGKIGPLDESSEVDIRVAVTEAQIDEAMEAAFGPGRGAVITALFNDERHQQLLDAGLIRTPEQAAAEARELATLEAPGGDAAAEKRLAELRNREQVPVFSFRGKADVNVHVHSPRGVDAPYLTSVDVFLPSVGLVPEVFPYPLVAENVAVEVRNQKGRLTFGTFRGLSGGHAGVEATFNVPGKADADTSTSPEILIQGTDLPLDALLFNALPGETTSGSGGIKSILRDLRVSALATGMVRIAARPTPEEGDQEELGFDADVEVRAGEARPAAFGSAGEVAVAGLTGHFEASERELSLDLEGIPVKPRPTVPDRIGPPPPLSDSEAIGGTLTVHVHGRFPPSETGVEPSFLVAATCPTFDLGSPFESLVGVFSDSAAGAVERARREFHPAGSVDVRAQAESGPEDEGVRLRVTLDTARNLAADLLGGRATIPKAAGKVSLIIGPPGTSKASFDAVSGMLEYAGAPAGIVSIDGALPLGEDGAPNAALEACLLGGRFDSALTRSVLEQLVDRDAGAVGDEGAFPLYTRLNPSGEFDATMIVRRSKTANTPLVVHGRIEPRSLTLRLQDTPVTFTDVSGVVEFEPGSGVLRELRLEAPEWAVRADGAWSSDARGITLRTAISARGNKLSDDLRAILPSELQSLFSDLKLTISGPFQLSEATLDLYRVSPGATNPSSAHFAGLLEFADASLEAGVPISNMNGKLLVSFDNAGPIPAFTLDLRAKRFEVAGITLTDGEARIRNGSSPGEVLVPAASGMCHGGRFHVSAQVEPDGPEPGAPRRYQAAFQLAGVRFGPLLRELVDTVKPLVGPPAPGDGADPNRPAPRTSRQNDFARGLLDAELTLSGLTSDTETRRGRGTMRVSGGRVLNLPFMTGLIEAGNLRLPVNASLDFAWASMFIEGPLITFEELSVQSRAVEISGGGTMTWPERELDLRLQSRSTRPIPILSDIVQGIRHQLMVTTITGKLGEHEVGIQSPGPTRMLGGIVRGGDGRAPIPAAGTENRASADRERERKRTRGIRPVSPPAGTSSAGHAGEGP